MKVQDKELLLASISKALDTVEHGKIIIDLRGCTRPVDIVVENRTRFAVNTPKPKKSLNNVYRGE